MQSGRRRVHVVLLVKRNSLILYLFLSDIYVLIINQCDDLRSANSSIWDDHCMQAGAKNS